MNHHISTVKQFISTVAWDGFKMKAQEFTELQTERLDLRPLSATFDFANYLFDIISHNRDFFRFMPWANIDKPESEFEFLQSAVKDWKKQEKATYGMFLRTDNSFVGVCTMFNLNYNNESGEIGYWLNPKYAKHGFMNEAVQAISTEFFNKGLKRIVILANTENVASCKVAKKCGFEQEGVLHSYDFLPTLSKREDVILYAKIKKD